MFKTFVSLFSGHASDVCFLLAQGGYSKWFCYECYICFGDFKTKKWKMLKSQLTIIVTSLADKMGDVCMYQRNIVCVNVTIVAVDKQQVLTYSE